MAYDSEYTDEDLIHLVRNGDHDAFAELFFRYNRLLFITSLKFIDNQEEAKDLVQDTFVQLWNQRDTLAIRSSFKSLLYTALRNRIFDILSHKKVEAKFAEFSRHFYEDSENRSDHLLRTHELEAIIEKEISYLPDKMQEIFIMSRMNHLNHRQISEKLSISEKTVKNQINNALKILKNRLGPMRFMLL